MKFISLFSGIGGFDLGLERAGHECIAQVEKDKHALMILEKHWPKVRRFHDVTDFKRGRATRGLVPELIVGGFPCQDLSVAGKRAGLAGARSGLFFEFMRIVDAFAPRVVLIENVPGLFSGCGCPLCRHVAGRLKEHLEREQRKDESARSCECGECAVGRQLHQAHSGRNLAIVLSCLAERGYGWAYRVLDSQYFGLAQRRERVFIVGCLGNARRLAGKKSRQDPAGLCRLPCEILFEPDCLPWHRAPRREKRQEVAGPLGAGTDGSGWRDDTDRTSFVAPTLRGGTDSGSNEPGNKIAFQCQGSNVGEMGTLRAGNGKALSTGGYLDASAETFIADGPVGALQSHAKRHGHAMGTQQAAECGQLVTSAFRTNAAGQVDDQGDKAAALTQSTDPCSQFIAHTLRSEGADASEDGTGRGSRRHQGVLQKSGVRRLTPTECERLQGFPDGWTEALSDSARYRVLGNAVSVPVAEWIGKRLKGQTE